MPDGRSLIAVESSSTAPPQLVRLSLDGGNHLTPQLPASSQDAFRSPQQPRVSPDGRLVAFSDNWDVYVRPLDGAGMLQVTDSGGSWAHPEPATLQGTAAGPFRDGRAQRPRPTASVQSRAMRRS